MPRHLSQLSTQQHPPWSEQVQHRIDPSNFTVGRRGMLLCNLMSMAQGTSSLVAFTSTIYVLVMQSGAALVSKSMFYQLSLPVHAGQLVSSALTNRFIWNLPSSSKVSRFMERSLHLESVCIDLQRATWSSLYGALDCCISATLAQALWCWKGKFSHQTAQGLQQVSKGLSTLSQLHQAQSVWLVSCDGKTGCLMVVQQALILDHVGEAVLEELQHLGLRQWVQQLVPQMARSQKESCCHACVLIDSGSACTSVVKTLFTV